MLEGLINDYLEYALHEVGCTPKTVNGYKYQFTLLLRHLGNVPVTTITIDELTEYFRSEEDRGLTVSSVNTARAVVRLFFYYCQYYRNIKLQFDYKMIRKKKCEPPSVRVATAYDVRRALLVLDDPQDKLIILMLSQTCVRVSELVRLRVEDISTQTCEVSVYGKGRKQRLVYITNDLARALNKHMADNNIVAGPVFRHRVTKYSLANKGYTVSGLRNRFIRKLEPHGIYAGFHWYRHGGATDMMRNGAGIFFLKEYLGHSDIRSTQRYLHITDNEKQEGFNKYYKSPVNINKVLT